MIWIKNNWEMVNDVEDVIKIISDNINQEFADKCRVFLEASNIEEVERICELESELEDLESELNSLQSENDELLEYKEIHNKVEKLLKELEKDYLDTTDDQNNSYGDSTYYQCCGARLSCLSQYIRKVNSMLE